MIKLFTIGFTQKSALDFFEGLKKSGIRRVIDTRLNNTSQLAGFAKQSDLRYFLEKIGKIEYVHDLSLAPTKEILEAYKKKKIPWEEYSTLYLELIQKRRIEDSLDVHDLQDTCFLCSENKPHFCHRRLAAEYLKTKLDEHIEIVHL